MKTQVIALLMTEMWSAVRALSVARGYIKAFLCCDRPKSTSPTQMERCLPTYRMYAVNIPVETQTMLNYVSAGATLSFDRFNVLWSSFESSRAVSSFCLPAAAVNY